MSSSVPSWVNPADLTFDNEFNTFTSSTNGSTGWMTTYPYGGESDYTEVNNKEAEYYSSPSLGENPFSLNNGVLTISATPAAAGSNPYGLPYDSGLITTYKSFSQLYGYFEVSAELPAGQGLWPAFWMLPANNTDVAELDIFEVLGSNPSKLYATTHGTNNNGSSGYESQALNVANTSTGFHTYGVDWEPNTVTFYMDGQVIATAPTPASMDLPMYMLLNLAVGGAGSWPGAPNSSTAFPAGMEINYVRAYASPNTTIVTGSAALPPSPPAITGLTTATDTGLSNTDGITSDATPVVTGTASTNATVTLKDNGGTVLGTTVAGANGAWSVQIATPLANGTHALTATETDTAGTVSSASAAL